MNLNVYGREDEGVDMQDASENLDPATVAGFGLEWSRYDQEGVPSDEMQANFDAYFNIFPWSDLPSDAIGFDLGCGSGRWAKLVAPRVHQLHCIDASKEALDVAKRNLRAHSNCHFECATVDRMGLAQASMDFGYSLGVLHHVPDTAKGLRSCVEKLKPGAPFLLYLYYRFDNKPVWFRSLWRASDAVRKFVSHLPHESRLRATKLVAGGVYFPLARAAKLLEFAGVSVENFPLSYYRNTSFYTMSTDALDRFGTQLEQRFTRQEVLSMMRDAGLGRVTVSSSAPYWCAVGHREH